MSITAGTTRMLTCTKCKQALSEQAFSIRRASKTGRNPWCRACAKIRAAALRAGKKAGVPFVSPQEERAQAVRGDYFAVLDTPTKAYILGLLMADGYIDIAPITPMVCLDLKATDKQLVEFVRDELAPIHSVDHFEKHERGKTFYKARLRITSAQLAADLARHGVVPNKTGLECWPAELPDEFAWAFVLGYFDGDGCLNWVPTPRCWRSTIVCASPDFLIEIQHWLAAVGIHSIGPRIDKTVWRLHIDRKADVRKLDTWMHQQPGLGLARKAIAWREQHPQYTPGKRRVRSTGAVVEMSQL